MSSVKLVFSFCANAKFKDITCIITHHYHVFHVLRWFYSVNKSCSINCLSITHEHLALSRSSADSSHTVYWKNIWEPRRDHIIMEFALYRTALYKWSRSVYHKPV